MTPTVATTIEQAIYTAYYEETYDTARALAHKFWRQFGGDLEDYLSQLNEILLLCFNSYQHGTDGDNLLKAVKLWVWYSLHDSYRKDRRLRTKDKIQTRTTSQADGLSWVADARSAFDLQGLLSDLSGDAQAVVSLVIFGEVLAKPSRATLTKHLKKVGWSTARIATVFDEIKDVL